MTSIAEEKSDIEVRIKNLATAILAGRAEAVGKAELAQEFLEIDGILDGDMPLLSVHYGEQRAILKGRSAGDAFRHTINGAATYSSGLLFTLPTITSWGYVVVDDAGTEVVGFTAADYYLAKDSSNMKLPSLEEDPAAYSTPVVAQSEELVGVGTAIGAKDTWTASILYKPGNLIQPTTPNGFFYRVTVSGTSGSAEPTFPTTIGTIVADGGITWVCEGREQAEWTPSTLFRANQPVYPATAMGSFFQASVSKQVEATHAASPDYLALAAISIRPDVAGNAVNRVGNWQNIFGPATGISTFGYQVESGSNRLVVLAIAVEDSVASTPVRTATFGNRTMLRIATVEAALSPGFSRVELWYLPEAEVQLLESDKVVISFETNPDGVGAYAISTYQNVDQEIPVLGGGTSAEPTATNPITTTVEINANTMQIAAAWSGVNGGFTWESEWTRQVNIATIPNGGGSLSVADSDDAIGISSSVEPTWPSTVGASVVDGNITWVNLGSTIFNGTIAADEMVPNTVNIRVDGVTVAQDDGVGAIVPVSGFDNVASGTVHYTTGVVNVTFKVPPELGQLVFVQYDAVIEIDNWRITYEQLDFSIGTQTYGSSNQFTLRVMTAASGELTVEPKLLTTYRIRKKEDHSILGTMIILTEGLQANDSWDHLNDPATEATEVPDDEFEGLFGWLDPAFADDVADGANPENVSTAEENPTSIFPNIEKNPLFPATNGNHAALQPGSLTAGDALAGDYANVIDLGGGDHVQWFVLSGLRFRYELAPTNAEMLSQGLNPDPEAPDELGTGLQNIIAFSPVQADFPLRIPADVSGGNGDITFAAVGAGGGAGSTYVGWSSVSDWVLSTSYSLEDFVIPDLDTWQDLTLYSVDDRVVPTVPNGFYYKATSGGTSGNTEPDWPASGSVVDGSVTWEVIGTSPADFAYEVTSAGTSGAVPPEWPTVVGDTVVDNSVTWTCRSDVSGEFACYYNEVQHLIDQAFGIAFLQSQMDKISALGVPTNTVDPGQQASDDQFETDQETFETDLDGFVTTDHGSTVTAGYNPLLAANRATGGNGSDYPFAEIETNLDGAAVTFQTDLDNRITEIDDDVLGTDVITTTSGLDYARQVFNAVNNAANFQIGYARGVNDKLNTITAIYDIITQLQANHAVYP